MQKNIRAKSLDETRIENQKEIGSIRHWVLGVVIIFSVINVGWRIIVEPFDEVGIAINLVLLVVIWIMLQTIKRKQNIIKRIKDEIKGLKNNST